MTTDYPYSQQWRERTRERARSLGLKLTEMVDRCGLDIVDATLPLLDPNRAVSLEIAGPIDELLDRLEEEREAEALDECVVHHPGVGSPTVRRVEGVDLGALVDCRIRFEEVVP